MSPIMAKPVEDVNKPRRPQGSSDDVLEAIHGVMHLYRSRQHRVLRDSPQAVTHMESKVLGFFARHPGATQSDLVAHSGRDQGLLAKLIGGLRDRGMLAAAPDATDKRVIRLQLTERGQAADQALRRQARRLSTVAVQGFSEAERAKLAALLERVRLNLEAADGGG
jgi:DNA-binding MarR family transcriptional regulator